MLYGMYYNLYGHKNTYEITQEVFAETEGDRIPGAYRIETKGDWYWGRSYLEYDRAYQHNAYASASNLDQRLKDEYAKAEVRLKIIQRARSR